MYVLQIHEVVTGDRFVVIWCTQNWSEDIYRQLYAVGMMLVILVIPVSVMTFAYASIGEELWIVTSRRVTMRAGK